MANDRIFIRCPKCEQERLLLAYWPASVGRGPSEDINEWMTTHMKDCGEKYGPDLAGDPFFTLTTESDGKPRVYA